MNSLQSTKILKLVKNKLFALSGDIKNLREDALLDKLNRRYNHDNFVSNYSELIETTISEIMKLLVEKSKQDQPSKQNSKDHLISKVLLKLPPGLIYVDHNKNFLEPGHLDFTGPKTPQDIDAFFNKIETLYAELHSNVMSSNAKKNQKPILLEKIKFESSGYFQLKLVLVLMWTMHRIRREYKTFENENVDTLLSLFTKEVICDFKGALWILFTQDLKQIPELYLPITHQKNFTYQEMPTKIYYFSTEGNLKEKIFPNVPTMLPLPMSGYGFFYVTRMRADGLLTNFTTGFNGIQEYNQPGTNDKKLVDLLSSRQKHEDLVDSVLVDPIMIGSDSDFPLGKIVLLELLSSINNENLILSESSVDRSDPSREKRSGFFNRKKWCEEFKPRLLEIIGSPNFYPYVVVIRTPEIDIFSND